MPGKGTPKRSGIRVDDELWEAAKAKARRLGVDLATIQRDMLRAWVEQQPDNDGEK